MYQEVKEQVEMNNDFSLSSLYDYLVDPEQDPPEKNGG